MKHKFIEETYTEKRRKRKKSLVGKKVPFIFLSTLSVTLERSCRRRETQSYQSDALGRHAAERKIARCNRARYTETNCVIAFPSTRRTKKKSRILRDIWPAALVITLIPLTVVKLHAQKCDIFRLIYRLGSKSIGCEGR